MCEDKKVTPMDIAADTRQEPWVTEMLSLLAEFTEMPDHVKIVHLSNLMYKDDLKAKEKEEFKNILNSLSIEMVSFHSTFMSARTSWNTSSVRSATRQRWINFTAQAHQEVYHR